MLIIKVSLNFNKINIESGNECIVSVNVNTNERITKKLRTSNPTNQRR